jgi:ABC-type proline/glycine betaine transport system ATPase subunit
MLLVTHDLREAFHLVDEVAVMRSGGIEQIASTSELRGSPASAYVTDPLDNAGVL